MNSIVVRTGRNMLKEGGQLPYFGMSGEKRSSNRETINL